MVAKEVTKRERRQALARVVPSRRRGNRRRRMTDSSPVGRKSLYSFKEDVNGRHVAGNSPIKDDRLLFYCNFCTQ